MDDGTQPPENVAELLNPTGRTGALGRGLLPAWGSNPAVVVIFTLEEKLPYSLSVVESESILRKVLVRACPKRKHQLPWVSNHSLVVLTNSLQCKMPQCGLITVAELIIILLRLKFIAPIG